MRRAGAPEVAGPVEGAALTRYWAADETARDSTAGPDSQAEIQVARLRLRLLLETERRDEHACIGVARVVERRADGNLVLDPDYVPTVLDSRASPVLQGMLTELHGLLRHRGDALAARVSAPGRGGVAEVADFLLLQAVNRYQPLLAHLSGLRGLHPEALYRTLVPIAGELATFTTAARRAPELPAYRHTDLQGSFGPVLAALRQSLSRVLEQNAVPVPLEERKYGIRVAVVPDPGLLAGASFVLAVRADLPVEEVRRRFPAQIKVGPVEEIRQLVNLQLPGVPVYALAVAPRQIPYHAGSLYFALERTGEIWKRLQASGGVALHVGGEFPGLTMELWAIRE